MRLILEATGACGSSGLFLSNYPSGPGWRGCQALPLLQPPWAGLGSEWASGAQSQTSGQGAAAWDKRIGLAAQAPLLERPLLWC